MEDYPTNGDGANGNGVAEEGVVADILTSAKAWLGNIEVGEPAHHRNLTVFPLFPKAEAEAEAGEKESQRYVLLDDAIEAGEATIEEVSEGGSVPLLAVTNTAIKPILIPEGQILVGAKQDRTVNLTVLVAAGTKFPLPVSCVEQGRWSYKSRRFKPESYAHPKLRRDKIRSAQMRRAAGGQAFSDQGQVWQSVEEHLHELGAPSATRNVRDAYRASEGQVKDYRDKIKLPDGACGFLAASGGQVIGVDLFDSPHTLRKLWGRLGEAYFAGAVSDPRELEAAGKTMAEAFMASVTQKLAPATQQPEVGFELELGGELDGTALWHEGAICHLAAFSVEA